METGVGLSSLADTLKRLTLNTPYRVHAPGLYLLRKLSYSPLCVEIRQFSLPWQQAWSDQSLANTLKFAVP